ncbi:hypothetical protein T02_15048 [Trichinella nativa]|uniref:Integrase catalytic domain-containing protein n=1 Tax=Trichinella nativa TaxID=6335 RepID=A0A0V1LIG5_9BILA|nr:hypothetical protein T02_15048 [Trichinella nativa]
MSKSRVAPLKTITLPRLEHMAALIAVKLVGFIKNSLAIPIQRIIFWTDSQIVFSWIRSEAKNWKPFVRNRVKLIQQLTEPKLWKYCSSENNPADLISRGTSVTKLKNCRLWWEGPPSLLNPEPCEKTCEENTQHPDEFEERCLFGGISLINDDQIEYNCRHASKERQEELTIEELNEAELYWMKPVENETFRDEESLLMEGHLQQSSLPYEHEHRVILQNKLNITDLTIRGEHKHQWHAGVEQTLAALRQRFWILKGRSIVKSVLRRCVDKYIYDLFRGDEKQKIARALTEEKIEWRFSCERSPWCGGYWERVENGPLRCDGCHNGNFKQTAAQARIGKLPELTLPLFHGEVLEFPTFWAQFEASVHANIELDDATKFAYLLSNTTGRALGAIAGIPVTAANYPEAADIKKMYLQIIVRPEDRDACRFLWWDDEQKIRRYRLTRVCFRRHQASAPRAAEEVLNNMYMDDLATSCDSVAEARSLADQLGSLLASGGFRPHKWASNEPDALRELPVEKTAMGIGSRPWMTLGIYWQRDDDHLAFVVPEGSRLAAGDTKRQMLSTASGIFDPIGCLAPFLVQAKILFQSLWETGADWDEPLPEEVNRPWIDWKRELDDLPLVRFPRALVSVPLDQVKQIELHAFCDASERAYGAVAYLRVETASGATRVNLVAAKTRVSPVKRLSLPRLEFMGALTAARLIRFAQRLPVLLERQRGHTCVGTVSAQSVEAIRPQSRRRDPTASGTGVLETLPGEEQPGRLTEPRIRGPSEHNSLLPSEEARVPQAALLVSVVTHTQDDVLHPGRYGDIERLFRITALCLRFARNCASATGERRRGPLTVQELDAAEQTWVRIAQRQGFRKEIDELRTSGDVAARSHLRPFSPCLDEAGTLRFGGRLEKSNLPLTEKHPAILPNEHEITPGLILRCHLRQLHAGVPDPSHATTALLGPAGAQSREAYYPQLSQCRWATARPTRPRMAALPDVRTTLAPAFAHVGMDFAGPLFVKTTRKTTSLRYVCLITCMVSRAVHLELVSEMSTVGVVQALRRFIARRGRPATIQTDNFRSFQSAASELRRLWRGIDVEQVQNELAGQRIQWHFIPPRAPWMGGYWERLIRTMKQSLRKVLGRALLDDEELRTILCEVEACLNARPLTLVEERPEGPVPLSPFKLLTSRTYIDLPEVDDTETNWHTPGEGPRRWDRQMVATLEERLPLHVAPAQEMDERYRGSEAERPRPDPGRQRPVGAMPPRGGGETFPRRRRRGLRSAAPDLHGGDD